MRFLVFFLIALPLMLHAHPASAGPFDDWAVLVVAGDHHAHSGAESDVFDNARRDLVKALTTIGFDAVNIQQYSAQAERDPVTKPLRADPKEIFTNFKRLTEKATGGCFVYFTSHGAPLGIVLGDAIVPLRSVADIIDNSCYDRPSVIVVSACFSGMFIPILRANNRMILTAARPDRTSFGCGEANVYTFFDQCVLESLPNSRDFPDLAHQATDCVGMREKSEGMSPPSEPQLYIGSTIGRQLPNYAFARRRN